MTYFKFGKNAKHNHELIKNAEQNDWWIHLKDDSSAHAIVEKDVIDEKDLLFACNSIYKKNKLNPKKFIYTQIKNLKIGKKAGEVIFKKRGEIKYFSLF
jgi:predicted ribosome quality control (RQC) complex YloA/Tae2 family protein